ncbi:MAG: AAA family ATPase, partial [Sandaracinaceae bacterium]
MSAPSPSSDASTVEAAHGVARRLAARLQRAVLGRDDVIDLVLTALLADGHVLLEDYPGSGKTTLARALGEAIEADGDDRDPHLSAFRRIQFTPDLLPSDITGTNVFDVDTSRFVFRHGPVFAHVVLADEINRTSPKVQAAMLEAMAEKQVTVDNDTHPLDALFFVISTQNRQIAEQAAWLDARLSESDARWRIVSMHHPIFSSGRGRDSAERRDELLPVLNKHQVDLVLQGHDHTYARGVIGQTPERYSFQEAGGDVTTMFVNSVSGPKQYEFKDTGWS